MRCLIDTHAIIWFITDDEKLPVATKNLIENFDNDCMVSTASLWEMAIKYSLDKLDLNAELEKVFELIEESPLEFFSISNEHILEVAKLPFHHRDPFDRIIIAQGRIERMKIITKDRFF